MALESVLAELGMDRYDRNARLRPALLVLLPATLMPAVWWPALWTLAGGLVALLVGCGVLFALSRYARYSGRSYERRMLAADGGFTTTRRLRHADSEIDPVTKARYHAALRRHGHAMPTVAEEGADPRVADHHYASAVNWLREQTRGDEQKLLLDENVDYGFRRNLAGMKPLGVVIAIVALVADAGLLWHGWAAHDSRWTAGVALAAALGADLLAWLGLVRRAFVRDAAESYAARLLAQCERI